MANNVKFSTGLEEDLLKLNSDKTYVHKIDNGHVYFATKVNEDGEVMGSIYYDVDGKRISMGGAGLGGGLDDMKHNIADTYVTRISSEGVKYADTDGVTITTYNGRNVALDTIMLPVASASRAGTVITGAQTFAGNKTFNNNILFPNVSTGVSSGIRWTVGDSDGARIVTGATAANAGYLEIAVKDDGNEPIYVRQYSGDFATLVRTLTLLDASGNTIIPGSLLPTVKDTKDLGSETYRWNNAYIKNLQADTLSGHLTGSLTGNVTGNVTGHASLDLPLAGGTMTGDITFASIASWPTASGETYPIKSKGLKWSGSSDNASIYYQVDGSDSGHLYLDTGDDTGASVKFSSKGVAHTVMQGDGKLFPVTNNSGSIGTSSNKFAAVYATNFYGIIEKAYQDESGNNIKATYASTLKNHAHDGSGWSFRLLNKNGAALADALTIPGATAEKAGLITTGAQTFAGKKTFNGQVVIANTTDAAKATANSGALIVGDPSGEHLAIDGNEIMAKASGTTVRALLFQLDGGETKFGGNVLPYTTDTHSLGTEALAWKEAHIGEIYGHLNGSLTGPVSGNASTASKWLTARKVTMTGDVTGNFTIDGSKDVSFAGSIADYSLKPNKLAVVDYENYSQLNRHTAAHWGFSVDTSDANGAIFTMNTISRDKFISEEFPCSGGEKFIITYEISTSCKGNSASGGTDSSFRGTAIGLYGYQKANRNTSAGIAYSTRVTGTADAPWTKVSSVVTVSSTARFFYVFVQTESWGNFSGSIKIRNLEVRRASGLDNAGDEILTKYLTRVAFAQADNSSSDTTKKLNLQVYNGNNALKATVQVPNASATEAGVVNTGTQTFAGNKTFSGRIHFSNTTDATKGSDSGVITIGTKTGEHMLLDTNEIMVKGNANTSTVLHLQAEGGNIETGGPFIPKGNKALDLGTSSNYWKNAYISNLVADTLSGHLTGSMTGNVTGNASSATKLLTARNIILGNDLQGSVSFDGTKDVTISAASYSASISGGNTSNYPWHRIATLAAITTDYADKDAVIAIRHAYNGGGYGIAKISLRTNQASTGATANCSISWIVRYGIAEDALQAGFRNTAKDSYADIFYKCGTWPRATVYQLQGNRSWTLISSSEVDNTTTTDAKTSKEAYATIAAAGTALGRTYTSTVVASDVGIVAKAFEDESGNNIKTSYLASIQQVTSNGTTFTFRGYNKNNAAMNNLITIPKASDTVAGLVTNDAQTWAGNKTFKGDITIQHGTANTMTTSSTNPYLRFLNSDGSQGVYIMFTDYDSYRAPGGLKVFGSGSATPAWFEVEGALIVGGASTLNGNITVKGNIMPSADNTYVLGDLNAKWKDIYSTTAHVYQTLYVNTSTTGTVGGITLHGTVDPTVYGIAMRSNLGVHGYATDTWNTYFMMSNGATRGWVFRNGSTNVASINGQGYAQVNKLCLNGGSGIANGLLSWDVSTGKVWYDYFSDTSAGGAPNGGKPSVLGSITGWALRSLANNAANRGWVWESAANSAASSTSTAVTPIMALASDTGKLYLKNDINIITGDNDRFIHFLYNTKNSDGFTVDSTVNTVGASWRAGVKQSTSDNEFAIESGSASPTATAWLNGLKITQATLNATFGTTTLGGLGIANTSASTGHGISLYNGGMSGKPTFGLMFAGTATFKTHGYVTGNWATYFTMDGQANRGWIFLKDANPVASISNDGKANFGETYIRGPLKIGDNANGDTNYIAFYGTSGDNPGSFNHAYIGENLWGTSERSELLIFKGNDIGATATASGSGPDRIRHVAAAHLFQIYTSALSGTWTAICDSTVPVNVFEINQSGIVVTGAAAISGKATVGGTLDVTGNTTLGAELSVTSFAKFKQGSAATALNTGAVQVTGGISVSANSYFANTIITPTGIQQMRWTTSTTDNNPTGRSWYGFGTYANTSDSNYNWFNLSNYWGINITTRGDVYLRHNDKVIPNTNNTSGNVGSSTQPIYSSGGVLTASTANVGSDVKLMYLKSGVLTASAGTIGNTDRPVYLSGGTITQCGTALTDYIRKDGSNYFVQLTDGSGNNTTGYRLIGQVTLGTWSNYRQTWLVSSRHAGNGILSIAFGNNTGDTASTANIYCQINYYGNTDCGNVITADSFTAYVSGSTIYFFWRYTDYSPTNITILGAISKGFTPSNGAWMTSIATATYGTKVASTTINPSYFPTLDSRYVNVTGDTMTGALNLANGTWNKAGDDAQFGDNNTAGSFAIQGINGPTNLKMVTYAGSSYGTITWNGSQFSFSHDIINHKITWDAVIQGKTWSRICYVPVHSSTSGANGILAVKWTRGNVVANAVFSIVSLHTAGYARISQLISGPYTQFQIRAVNDTTGNMYIEIYDDAASIASTTQQSINCTWIPLLAGNITKYTSFTSGASLPSGFAVGSSFATAHGMKADQIWGAVWNDYAEYRNQNEYIGPGYCVTSSDKGVVYKTTERLQACDGITSDTFGFAIGETDDCKTPLAVAGRVLAYCSGNRHDYHAGDAVCAGPEGKVMKMTEEEIRLWPHRIIGTVSEIPEYETWGSGNVKVNGRIWIKVK